MKTAVVSLVLLSALCGCTANTKNASSLKEAPDSNNSVGRFALTNMPSYEELAATKEVFTTKLPWSDTYWPLTQAGMARRWGKIAPQPSSLGFSSFWQDEIDESHSTKPNPFLSPAEKYDILFRLRWQKTVDEAALKKEIDALTAVEANMANAGDITAKRKVVGDLYTAFVASKTLQSWSPMAAEGWNRWLTYNKNSRYQYRDEKESGEDWSWMGYCHGWAPAALMHEAPKHSVLAKINGKEVFLGEGDIRGLLTKAWADHSPGESQYFLGRRCNENTAEPSGEIPSDADGRGATGTYTDPSGQTKTFTMTDEYLPGGAVTGRRIYQITVDQNTSSTYLIEKTNGSATSYFLSADTEKMKVFVETGAIDGLQAVKAVKFYGCWDVNPASFHTILTEYLGKKNLGFVMDRTRTGQVWNQPVYGARFTVGPLLDAAAVDDVLFRYRAPGTTYLSEVQAEVLWSSEPSRPSLDYADDFDRKRISSIKYTYTLEFDADRHLIGGEWGDLKADNKKLVIPDFLFAFKQGAEPKNSIAFGFDFSGILKPIYLCSQDMNELKTMLIDGKTVAYTECTISQGQ